MNPSGRNKSEVKGQIGYFGLVDWWFDTFTEEERAYIDNAYVPFSATGQRHPLVKGEILSETQTIGMFLSNLASWFRCTQKDRDMARRILAKALEVIDPQKDIFGLYFTYQTLIEVWYRDRDNLPGALEDAIKACREQIAIAPEAALAWKKRYPTRPLPAHAGFTKLTLIYTEQNNRAEAVRVAQQAKQQGWAGDWDKQIASYQMKSG